MIRKITIILLGMLLFNVLGINLPAESKTIEVSPQGYYATLTKALAHAQDGDTIEVRGGQYSGPLKIEKSVLLLGNKWPVIDGRGQETVIEVNAQGVHLEGLNIRNSGTSLSQEHAGITVTHPAAVIQNNRIENVLFGVYLKQADHSIIRNNKIVGKKELDVPRRGDLIRVWYSDSVKIEDNVVENGRDVIIWFSKGTRLRGNSITNARYGIHFMYSDDCRIENNILTGNSVGAYLMYSRRLHLIHNTIAHNRGPSGYGIGLKDFDDGLLIENLIVDNRVGLFVDNSPREIESTMTYRGNVIAYNDIGMKLFSFIERSKIVNNSFMENYEQVAVSGSGLLTGNDWNQNFWSDYVGYDQGDDGIGDIPYKYENLFENLMNKHPNLRLFIYSPAIQALEFAAQAFPVVKPKPKFVDPNPRMTPSIPQGLASIDLPTRWTLSTAALGLIVFGSVLTLGLSKKSKRLNRDAKMKSKKTNKPGPKHSSEKEHTAEMWIEVRHLTKRFGKLTAVNDVSFTVTRGEAVAFWGSNGAGKTTVLRCLLGVIPFQGDVSINGYKVNEESKQARHLIGFVPQEISFHDNLSVQETVEFYAQLKKSTPETIGDLIDKLGLRPHVLKTIKELSGGMKQRVALAIALLGNPPILFLDEPTANLDMRSRDDFLELLGELQEEGKTIVFSSHRLEEVFSFSNRVLILDQGKLIADSPPDEVYEHLGKHSLLRIYVSPQLVSNALDILTNNGFKVSRNGKGLKVQVDSHSKGKPITLLAKQGVPVDNFEYEVES